MQAQNQTSIERDVRNAVQLAAWTLAWTATLALARFGPEHLWDYRKVASWVAIIANIGIGVGLMLAHARYLQGLDELQRKINLDALAVTLGVGFVGGFAWSVANHADLLAADANIALFPVLMSVVYIASIVIGNLRYR